MEAFVVSAVVSMLVTRLYLQLTGFPRIGGGELHVAHLLWGGLLMLIALVVLLTVLGKRAKRVGAVIGGLGFGLFVDELGKFVTADNDYFFRPAIALIYVVFVCLFLVARAIGRRSLSADELLANAADMVRELVLGGATRGEVARARRLLDRSGARGPLSDGLEQAFDGCARVAEHRGVLVTLAARAWRVYDALLDWPWFQRAIVLVFAVQAIGGLIAAAVLGWTMLSAGTLAIQNGAVATSSISVALVIVGIVRLPTSRLSAYRWFERSVLVSIMLTRVILFWEDQLAALGGLVWDLVLLATLQFLIRQEEPRVFLRHSERPPRLSPNL